MSRVRLSYKDGQHNGPNYLRVENYPGSIWGTPIGNRTTYYYTDWTTNSYLGRTLCADNVSPGPPYHKDNDLDIERSWCVPFQMEGYYTVLASYGRRTEYHYEGYGGANTDEWQDASLHFSSVNSAARERLDEYAIEAIANANPTNPDVDILLFLWEFKDFPRLLREHGKRKMKLDRKGALDIQDAASVNLELQFAWAPLIGDLKKLLKFQETVDKRLRYLQRLAKGKQNIHRVLKRSTSYQAGQNWVCREFTFATEYKYSELAWYSLELTATGIPSTYEEQLALAKRLAYSTNISYSTVWNAIPWSWLIDWFTNIGTFLETHSNEIGFTWKNLNVMLTHESSRTTEFLSSTLPSGVTSTSPSYHSIVKLRRISNTLSPDLFKMPVITGRQAGILGSLFLVPQLKGL